LSSGEAWRGRMEGCRLWVERVIWSGFIQWACGRDLEMNGSRVDRGISEVPAGWEVGRGWDLVLGFISQHEESCEGAGMGMMM
jgi:hypothetical protein